MASSIRSAQHLPQIVGAGVLGGMPGSLVCLFDDHFSLLPDSDDDLTDRIGIRPRVPYLRQEYITLLYDLDRSSVVAMADGRDTNRGLNCSRQISAEQSLPSKPSRWT